MAYVIPHSVHRPSASVSAAIPDPFAVTECLSPAHRHGVYTPCGRSGGCAIETSPFPHASDTSDSPRGRAGTALSRSWRWPSLPVSQTPTSRVRGVFSGGDGSGPAGAGRRPRGTHGSLPGRRTAVRRRTLSPGASRAWSPLRDRILGLSIERGGSRTSTVTVRAPDPLPFRTVDIISMDTVILRATGRSPSNSLVP